MKLYVTRTGKLAHGPITGWYGTQAEAKKAAGKDNWWGLEEVPVDKPSLLIWLNNRTVLEGLPLDREEQEVDEIEQAEMRAVAAAAPSTTLPSHERNWEASDIAAFVLERASVAQAENIFAALGTRFKELANGT